MDMPNIDGTGSFRNIVDYPCTMEIKVIGNNEGPFGQPPQPAGCLPPMVLPSVAHTHIRLLFTMGESPRPRPTSI